MSVRVSRTEEAMPESSVSANLPNGCRETAKREILTARGTCVYISHHHLYLSFCITWARARKEIKMTLLLLTR